MVLCVNYVILSLKQIPQQHERAGLMRQEKTIKRWALIIFGVIVLLGLSSAARSDQWPAADESSSELVLRGLTNAGLVSSSVHLGEPRIEGGFQLTSGPDKTPCGFLKCVMVVGLPQLEELRLEPVAAIQCPAANFMALALRIQQYYVGYQEWDKPFITTSAERTDWWVARMARCRLLQGGVRKKDGLVVQFTFGCKEAAGKPESDPVVFYAIRETSRPEDAHPAK